MKVINIKTGVIVLTGDSILKYKIENIAHTIDLYIKYGNNSTEPIKYR